jgi:hypothetical protein
MLLTHPHRDCRVPGIDDSDDEGFQVGVRGASFWFWRGRRRWTRILQGIGGAESVIVTVYERREKTKKRDVTTKERVLGQRACMEAIARVTKQHRARVTVCSTLNYSNTWPHNYTGLLFSDFLNASNTPISCSPLCSLPLFVPNLMLRCAGQIMRRQRTNFEQAHHAP